MLYTTVQPIEGLTVQSLLLLDRWKFWLIWLVSVILSRWARLCQSKLKIGLCHNTTFIQCKNTTDIVAVSCVLYTVVDMHVCVFQGAVPDGDGEIVAPRGIHVRSLQCVFERAGFCGGTGLRLLPALL